MNGHAIEQDGFEGGVRVVTSGRSSRESLPRKRIRVGVSALLHLIQFVPRRDATSSKRADIDALFPGVVGLLIAFFNRDDDHFVIVYAHNVDTN